MSFHMRFFCCKNQGGNKMTKGEFYQVVEKTVQGMFPNAIPVIEERDDNYYGLFGHRTVLKLETMDALVRPVLDLDVLYSRMGVYDETAVENSLTKRLEEVYFGKTQRTMETMNKDTLNQLTNYECMKKLLFVVPIKKNEANIDDLTEGCSITGIVEDIYVQVRIQTDQARGEFVVLSNGFLEVWKQNLEQIYKDAINNTPTLFPTKITEINTQVKGIPEVSELGLYMVSNSMHINGSVNFFANGVMDELAEKVGGAYYVLPNSKNDVIIVPESIIGNISQKTNEVMGNVVEMINGIHGRERQLSQYAFFYVPERRTLFKASTALMYIRDYKPYDKLNSIDAYYRERVEGMFGYSTQQPTGEYNSAGILYDNQDSLEDSIDDSLELEIDERAPRM